MPAKRAVKRAPSATKRVAKASAPATAASKSGGSSDPDGRPAVKAWLVGIDPAQRRLARGIDALILATLPDAGSAVKYRKPSQPLGVPFYGLPGKGWVVFVNSPKGRGRGTVFAGAPPKP